MEQQHTTANRGHLVAAIVTLTSVFISSAATAHALDDGGGRGPCIVWTSGVERVENTPDGDFTTISTWCDQYADYGPSEGPADEPPTDCNDPACDGGIEPPDPKSECDNLAEYIAQLEGAYRWANEHVLDLERSAVTKADQASADYAAYQAAQAKLSAATAARIGAEAAYRAAGHSTSITVEINGREITREVGYQITDEDGNPIAEGRDVVQATQAERDASEEVRRAYERWRMSSDPARREAMDAFAHAQQILANHPGLIEAARGDYGVACR